MELRESSLLFNNLHNFPLSILGEYRHKTQWSFSSTLHLSAGFCFAKEHLIFFGIFLIN